MIGSGFMGDAHSNAFCQVSHFFDTPFEIRRKVICARDRGRLEGAASRWGWEEVETDWRAVVDRPDIQVVDVAVPNALHGPIAIAAAAGREDRVMREASGDVSRGSRANGGSRSPCA